MTFIEFCIAHGIVIDKPPRLGHWERYPTEAHPRKRNGAVKWMGDYGFLQDHAVHTEVIFWKSEKPVKVDPKIVRAAITKADEERKQLQKNAELRAAMILNRCVTGRHDYLRRKGFPEERGLIWCHDQTEHLIVPMRDEFNELVGVQTIDAEGNKKFLYGQKTRGANFMIGQQGVNVLCEGYATGLSVRDALRSMKIQARIYVCFSAQNLVEVAKKLSPGLVIADNDRSGTGESVAKKTGWRYWISDQVGEDFNDCHRRKGLASVALSLFGSLYPSASREGVRTSSLRAVLDARKVVDQ
jgi:hypothetical protein